MVVSTQRFTDHRSLITDYWTLIPDLRGFVRFVAEALIVVAAAVVAASEGLFDVGAGMTALHFFQSGIHLG